eukprot:CAMPEP_0201117746 /NCGR_PEP_ID=MMETSP0850-20130426/1765_1 /ASSEMBLY_ACC=CAM_ASM_000622 /TAXON_ID=183588 /ORGANISM="Pseudo-nitzschia fraudulenta, Strain WWA7" /LENGTH=327 /DNA_ID=CAMNT_0047382337 /DNA_START=102 /DNA_END=1085 /DNA_ORIENTATION=+
MSSRHLLSFFLWAASGPVVLSFAPAGTTTTTTTTTTTAAPAISFASSSSRLGLFDRLFGGSGGGSEARIPSTTGARDEAAIESCRKAIENPRSGDCPLIELEFPALAALNKLGDGSLRSTTEAEDANLAFVSKLVRGISPSLPFAGGFLSPGGGRVTVVLGSSSTNSFRSRAEAVAKKSGAVAVVSSSSSSVSALSSSRGDRAGGICVFVTPASRGDYAAAQKLARSGSVRAVVLVNAFAKDPGSVPGDSTMAYFLKPLTYNSAVAGYLVRSYPGPWTVLDATTGAVLGSFSDEEILVGNTNTPDLRASGRMVQRSVDERAIAARNR